MKRKRIQDSGNQGPTKKIRSATPLSSWLGDATSSYLTTSSEDTLTSSQQDNTTSSDLCSLCKTKLLRNPHREVRFTTLYSVGRMLGQGGYGCVYGGTRRKDGKEVAIKIIPRRESEPTLTMIGTMCRHTREVVLMHLVSESPVCENVVELLDWYELPHMVILVLERPTPCMDLFYYLMAMGGKLDQAVARVVMQQVVVAALHCDNRFVFHRDIKLENLLVNTDTLDVKLIDFGCGDLLREEPYQEFAGTAKYAPPEWFLEGEYQGDKATVWSLGVLLFAMVNGRMPFRGAFQIVNGCLRFRRGISRECKNLVRLCLMKDPCRRLDLDQILSHSWMSDLP
ncbi:hypothetical protein DPEC_G00224730 [Dallia pectoralis]|uniref:Uncharacterized protein n=1 Tax=Dallia pectoralis TaxID=75939 RepID=A0ACC2G0J2_DALPE|nr:hypothetical protein DPEC_G00224730 [Dallia pectoralis]